MIIAAQKRKIKRKIRLYEDEITSCIFGEMRNLNPKALWRIFGRFVSYSNISEELWPEKEPTKVEFEFWPRIGDVEPDLIIHFYDGDNVFLHIMVEVKWGGKLFPKCELVRQWESRNFIKAPWLHLYLVKRTDSVYKEVSDSFTIAGGNCSQVPCNNCYGKNRKVRNILTKKEIDDWKKRLGYLSWNDFLTASKELGKLEPDFTKGIANFLENQDIISFSGFSWLCREMHLLEENNLHFFRPTPWFDFLKEESLQIEDTNGCLYFFQHT